MATNSGEDILQKLVKFCNYQERSIKEVEDKMKKLGVAPEEQEEYIERLQLEGFLDEERFARSFARSKFLYNQWGRQKIEVYLKSKGVPSELIEKGLNEIDPEQYEEVVDELARKKTESLKAEDTGLKAKQKVWRFLAQRGFEPEVIGKSLEKAGFD